MVPLESPFTPTDTVVVVSAGSVCVAEIVPRILVSNGLVPYSNQYELAALCGFTRPLRVALEVATFVAAVVLTVGKPLAAGPRVVKL